MPTELGLTHRALSADETRALEPSLSPVFRHAVHWPDAASVSNPLAVTKAYAAQFAKLGGVMLKGDARTLHRSGDGWRVDTDEGPIDAKDAVVALGPWAPDVLGPLGIRLPLAFKRGYHRHFSPRGNAGLTRPVVDTDLRLLPRADGAGHPPHHRRGIRRPRRRADAGAVRPRCCRRRARCFRWATGSRRSPGWDRGRALPIPGR